MAVIMIYDIIGDIHGKYDKLVGLFERLGYTQQNNVWVREGHMPIFVGDFIDRGEQQLAVLKTVFALLDKGLAKAVMGNHELNAILYATPSPAGYLRSHSETHTRQHEAFLQEVGFGTPLHAYWIERFFELPLWLDCPNVVHACWDKQAMRQVGSCYLDKARLDDPIYIKAVERLLKGVEITLPKGSYLLDKAGNRRGDLRIKWWHDTLTAPVLQLSAASGCDTSHIDPKLVVDIDFVPSDDCVFIGHYWLKDKPALQSDKVVCVDYSAGVNGHLTAYRLDASMPNLSADHFVQFVG